jgi:hypothetical protein
VEGGKEDCLVEFIIAGGGDVLVQINYSRKVLYVMMLVNKLLGKTAFEDIY